MTSAEDRRLFFPATERNREAIAQVLQDWLPQSGRVLEISSGSGEHLVAFAARFREGRPGLRWQPSDPDPAHQASCDAWISHSELSELCLPALNLDVLESPWPAAEADFVFCANMLHISPPETGPALFRGAATLLSSGQNLALYGPFRRMGEHTAPSNQAFDERLRARDPRWGVRDLESLTGVANSLGLARREIVPMPANNFCVLFERS